MLAIQNQHIIFGVDIVSQQKAGVAQTEVGDRKSEVGSRRSEIGNRKSEGACLAEGEGSLTSDLCRSLQKIGVAQTFEWKSLAQVHFIC
jgi:hypothetical protein